MKLVSRFALAAVTLAASITVMSCSSQSPTAPNQNDQSFERRAAPPLACDVALGAPASEIMNDGIPFKLSCENMAAATMTIDRTINNRFGCPVWVSGSVVFAGNFHRYTFNMFILRAGNVCDVDGGFVVVSSPLLECDRYLPLPVSWKVSARASLKAN